MYSTSDPSTSLRASVCGIDEAGRGALAGPLVAASVITTISLTKISRFAKTPIRDSKTLSLSQRERIYQTLERLQIPFKIETIPVADINNNGIGWANKQAMRQLIADTNADHYILDGNLNFGSIAQKNIESIVDADATIDPVILAGIVAKVTRDRIMQHLHDDFPIYGWNTNKGYGTAMHISAIKMYNSCCHHRTIFVQTALSKRV